MGQTIENKILELYYEFPEREFTVRELAKLSGVPRSTVQKYLVQFRKTKFIDRGNKILNEELFKIKKINYFIEKIVESGLIKHLVENLNPSSIILFGSVRKGDSVRESDIDLFVETYSKKEIDLTKYEKLIGHKIQLFIEKNINRLHDNLLNNVVNGIKLYGVFSIK